MYRNLEIFCDALSIVGESPLWDAKNNRLLYVDIRGKRLNMVEYDSGRTSHIALPKMAGAIVPAVDGRLLGCMEDGVYKIRANGDVVPVFAPLPLEGDRFNDVKAGPDGCMYGGTSATGEFQAAFYRIDKAGTMRKLLGGVGNANGMEWNADASLLYFNDTPTGKTSAYAFSMRDGDLSGGETVMDYAALGGRPDGMTIDNEGMLWVALWGGGRVVRVDPARKRLLAEIPLPVGNVASCVFAGNNYSELVITTAAHNTDLRIEPYAGAVFRLKTDVTGKPARRFG